MDIIYHYPPELLQLLVDTIPRLCRSKDDVLLFFRGAGVDFDCLEDLWEHVERDRQSIKKYEIVRTVLTRLNERGEATLRERREVLKRVVEFEDFSTCWPNDQLEAKGLVAEIRRVVNVKDSFARMKQERETERKKRMREHERKLRKIHERKSALEELKRDFYSLFAKHTKQERQRRGILLENVLNRLFEISEILIRESFRRTEEHGKGVVEQIDGVVELEGEIYLVEMKWLDGAVGIDDVSRHLVRIYHRGFSRGIFISATEFTQPALEICREALQKTVVVLCTLKELVGLFEQDKDLKNLLKEKIQAAIIDKEPFKRVL
jgi:restriction system protein